MRTGKAVNLNSQNLKKIVKEFEKNSLMNPRLCIPWHNDLTDALNVIVESTVDLIHLCNVEGTLSDALEWKVNLAKTDMIESEELSFLLQNSVAFSEDQLENIQQFITHTLQIPVKEATDYSSLRNTQNTVFINTTPNSWDDGINKPLM